MDLIDPILATASSIYSLYEQVKANKERSCRIIRRVKAFEDLVKPIKKVKQAKASKAVEKPLNELYTTLISAEELLRKYTSASWLKRILKSGSYKDDFDNVNLRLADNFEVLVIALNLEHGHMLFKVFDEVSRKQEDVLDGQKDDAEMKQLLLQFLKEQEEKKVTAKELQELKDNVDKHMKTLSKPNATPSIQEIKPGELKYDSPKQPFIRSSTSEIYKAKYHGFNVAVKRYINSTDASPDKVRRFFRNEIENMKQFESPNIMRMFGICVQDEAGPSPQFLIIMEFCDKGSLRQLLHSKEDLPWPLKGRMCLDAAQGLYRLHLTENKMKLHGCINSSKFLVDADYRVKLGGLELAKTETSLRRNPTEKSKDKDIEISSLCYTCPEKLKYINCAYTRESEIYSFGIVLWEIVTRKKPFEGWSREKIMNKVSEDKFREPLPEDCQKDCPDSLVDLINACRSYESFLRPSIGELVDKLCIAVERLETK